MKILLIIAILIKFCQCDNSIAQNTCFQPGYYRTSSNGLYKLILRHDGRLAVERTDIKCTAWESTNFANKATKACNQDDGHFVLYNDNTPGMSAIWVSGWHSSSSVTTTATIQDDGQFVIKHDYSIKFTTGIPNYCLAMDELTILRAENANLKNKIKEANGSLQCLAIYEKFSSFVQQTCNNREILSLVKEINEKVPEVETSA